MFDVDKIYMMRKSLPIKRKSFNDTKALLKEEFGKVKDREVNNFLKLVYGNNTKEAYIKYPDIAKFFRENCFEVEVPTEGRLYRDNKIIDMTYSVLTHHSQMDRLLKPGGFEEQKRMGYYITALKLGYEPKDLDNLSTSKLKELCYKQSNLIYFRDQAQFYKQNSIAGTILGIFASERSNHAYLEGDNLALLKEHIIIKLGNYNSNSDLIDIDPTYDADGNFIGDTLGNLVAAAADAVKDPVLNLMNINSTTANMLVTMVRIGVPFKTAALFLSSNTISNVLNTLNNKSLAEYTTLINELTNRIKELEEEYNIDENSKLAEENLSEQQLIENIQGKIDPRVEFKILNTALNLISLSSDLSKVSKVTRLNSITTAVGPLMSDNIIMKEIFNNFPENVYQDGKRIYITKLLAIHPILNKFFDAYKLPKQLMPTATAFSNTVQNLLNNLKANQHTKIYKQLTSNRELLNKFLDFVLNYSMVNGDNPAIDYTQLKYFIQKFPKEYALKDYKKVYPENQFIQSIQIVSKNGEITLKLDTTGMDEARKGELKNAWSDLYKKDPKLATYLYNYAYFKGGIGFNPKTFMGLLPNSLRIADTKRNNTLNNLPQIILDTFLDQYIGNNSEEYRIIKYLGKDNKIGIKKDKDGTFHLRSNTFIRNSDLGGYTYFKYNDRLYKLVDIQVHDYGEVLSTELVEIPILGNNNSYLEVSPEIISEASNLIEDTSDDLGLSYNQYVSEIEESDVQTLFSSSEIALAKAIKQIGSMNGWSPERIEARLEEIKKESDLDVKTISISKLKETIKASYEKESITYDEDKINEELKKYC